MADGALSNRGIGTGEAQVFEPYRSTYYPTLIRTGISERSARKKAGEAAAGKIPSLKPIEILPSQQNYFGKKSKEYYQKAVDLMPKIRAGDNSALIELQQMAAGYADEAALAKQNRENYLKFISEIGKKNKAGEPQFDDESLSYYQSYSGVNEKGDLDFFDPNKMIARFEPVDFVKSGQAKVNSAIKESGSVKEDPLTGITKGYQGITQPQYNEITSGVYDSITFEELMSVHKKYEKLPEDQKSFFKDVATRKGWVTPDGQVDEEKAFYVQTVAPKGYGKVTQTFQQPTGDKNKFTDGDIQPEAQFNIYTRGVGSVKEEEVPDPEKPGKTKTIKAPPLESLSATGKNQLSVGKQNQTITISPSTIDLDGNVIDKSAKVTNATIGSVSIVPVYKKSALTGTTTGKKFKELTGTVVNDKDLKEAQQNGMVEWKPYAQGTAPVGRDAQGKTMYLSFLQPLETVTHVFKGDTKDGVPLTEYYQQKASEMNTKSEAPYSNIISGQDSKGNKITIGVRGGKWYNIKTGEAIE